MNKESNIRVMVLDDETDFLEAIEFWLKKKGYQVEAFNNGNEAIKAIKKNPPDVLFLDIVMPEIDGIQVLKKIREFNQTLSVIMITAHSTPKRVQESEELGVVGYFMKSEDFQQAAELVQRALQAFKRLE